MPRFLTHILAVAAALGYCVAVFFISGSITLRRLRHDPTLYTRGNFLDGKPIPIWGWMAFFGPPIAFLSWWFLKHWR